jgi:hypothetical protein
MPENPNSHIVRVKCGTRETETLILEADDCTTFRGADGSLILQMARYGTNGRPLEYYQFRFCPEDAERFKAA